MKNNILIAEFMGMTFGDPNDNSVMIQMTPKGNEVVPIESMQFHKEWNWLMPVVIKIDNLTTLSSPQFTSYLYSLDMIADGHVTVWDSFNATTIISVPTEGRYSIRPVYEAVVEFINFYNQKK